MIRSCTSTDVVWAMLSDSNFVPASAMSLGVLAQHNSHRASTRTKSCSCQSHAPSFSSRWLLYSLWYPFSLQRHASTLSTTHFRLVRLLGEGRRLPRPLALALVVLVGSCLPLPKEVSSSEVPFAFELLVVAPSAASSASSCPSCVDSVAKCSRCTSGTKPPPPPPLPPPPPPELELRCLPTEAPFP